MRPRSFPEGAQYALRPRCLCVPFRRVPSRVPSMLCVRVPFQRVLSMLCVRVRSGGFITECAQYALRPRSFPEGAQYAACRVPCRRVPSMPHALRLRLRLQFLPGWCFTRVRPRSITEGAQCSAFLCVCVCSCLCVRVRVGSSVTEGAQRAACLRVHVCTCMCVRTCSSWRSVPMSASAQGGAQHA